MGYIDANGVYHHENVTMAEVVPRKTSVWKEADHDRQRADHAAELVQPRLSNGQPNPEFIRLYPDEARDTYHLI